MNRLTLFCFCVTLFTCLNPLFADGQLGDIIYSYLPENQFQKIHGDGWVNLSVQNDIRKTAICTRLNVCSLPNSAGKFMRISGGESAGVGVLQDYATPLPQKSKFSGKTNDNGEHYHDLEGSFFQALIGSSTPMATATDWMWKTAPRKKLLNRNHFHIFNITGGGDSETRPVNIVFNAYIKIDDGDKGSAQEEKIKIMDKNLKSLERKICSFATYDLSQEDARNIFKCHKDVIDSFEGKGTTIYRLDNQELVNSLTILRELFTVYSFLEKEFVDFQDHISEKYMNF